MKKMAEQFSKRKRRIKPSFGNTLYTFLHSIRKYIAEAYFVVDYTWLLPFSDYIAGILLSYSFAEI